MAAEIAERRNGLEPGVYATAPIGATREPGPVPNQYGALDGRQTGDVGAERAAARYSRQGSAP